MSCQSQKYPHCEEKFVCGSYTRLELGVMWTEINSQFNSNGGS